MSLYKYSSRIIGLSAWKSKVDEFRSWLRGAEALTFEDTNVGISDYRRRSLFSENVVHSVESYWTTSVIVWLGWGCL
jgi:hypothetical protein